jgi:hypothetical protein
MQQPLSHRVSGRGGDGSRLSIAGLVLLLALGAGCDAGDGGGDSVSARLYTPASGPDPFAQVGWVRLFVRGDGLDLPIAAFSRFTPGASAALPAVPFGAPGARRQLVVEAWAEANGAPSFLVSSARSPWFELPVGADPLSFDLLLSRVNALSDLPAVEGRASQRLQVGRVGAGVAVTSREVIVAGGAVVSDADAAWWRGAGVEQIISSVEALDLERQVLTLRGELRVPRFLPTVTAMPFGQAVIAGGFVGNGQPTAEVELYNPPGVGGGAPAGLPPLAVARARHSATLVDPTSGLILFVGGDAEGTWELWDPSGGSRGKVALPDGKPRADHEATPFQVAGRAETAVLVTGGESATEVHATAMLFEPIGRAMLPVGQLMAAPRTGHAAGFVPQHGLLYVLGGFTQVDRQRATATVDAFDVGSLTFRSDAQGLALGTARGGIDAAVLAEGRLLIAGGSGEWVPQGVLRPL